VALHPAQSTISPSFPPGSLHPAQSTISPSFPPGSLHPAQSTISPSFPPGSLHPAQSPISPPLLDDADEEVIRIISYTHTPEHICRASSPPTHTPEHICRASSPPTHTPGSPHSYLSLNACLSLDEEQRSCCLSSQLGSPVRKRKKKQRMSPPCISVAPPSEAQVPTVTQLKDSSMYLRRRTPSFDSTSQRDSLDMEPPELRLSVPFLQLDPSSISITMDSGQSGCLLLTGSGSTLDGEGREEGGARKCQSRLGLAPNPLRRRSLVRMLSTRDGEGEDPQP
ncbi:hypothetical protein UPYG_G00056880, partial [Umbra pygmaea]